MNSYRIFSRRTMGMDNRVWRTMIILVIIASIFLCYKIIAKEECIPFKFDIGRAKLRDSSYYVGDNITFIASTSAKKITWDFNDNSNLAEGASVSHTFSKDGQFYITAIIGQGCEHGMFITIKNKPMPRQTDASLAIKEISSAPSTIVGKEEQFVSPVLADSVYEWAVLYHPEMGKRYGERVKFKFPRPDKYTIELILDNNRLKNYRKDIFVEGDPSAKPKGPQDVDALIPKNLPQVPEKEAPVAAPPPIVVTAPVEEAPKTPKTKFVLDEIFKNYLQSLVENTMEEADFHVYLCGKGTTPVVVNGKRKDPKTFSWLCNELSGKKDKVWLLGKKRSVIIDFVKLYRDEANCVTNIEVNY